jgi:hypothetical protein
MTAPAAHATNPGQPRSLRLYLWWTVALVLIALGGAGLAVAADRPGNPVARPELTYRADAAAQPWIDRLAQALEAVHNDATTLSGAGRDVLGGLQALDLASVNAALDAGDRASADVETLVAGLHDIIGQARSSIDGWRLGPRTLGLFDQIDGAISGAGQLPADWATLAATGRTVDSLVEALAAHDRAVSQATSAARDSRWAEALALLHGTVADALSLATAARDQLAAGSPVGTLDDLLGRERAYDDALVALYQYLVDGGAQSGDQFRALQSGVEQAQAALPADNSVLVEVVGEVAGLPIADQLLAMEEAHGAINDALQAVSDARFGAPPIDGGPQQTPAP